MTVLMARPAGVTADPGGLPEGWALTHLGEACELNPPKPGPGLVLPDAPVTFVPMPSVDAASGAIAVPLERRFGEIRNGYTAFREGDVIFAKITPCMENGKAAIARGLTNELGFGSTEFHVLRPTRAVLPEYVYHFVRQESFRRSAEAQMTGSVGQRRVPVEHLASVLLPLPPLAEQRRIVAQVEALLARTSATRERVAKVPAILKRFRQAVLAAAYSGRLTADWRMPDQPESASDLLARIRLQRQVIGRLPRERASRPRGSSQEEREIPESWEWAPLSDLLSYTRAAGYGVLQPGPDTPGGVPMVRVCDIQDGTVLVNQLKRIAPAIDAQYKRTRLQGGEVVVSLVGTIGRTAVVPHAAAGANVARAVAMLPWCPEVVPRYVQLALSESSVNNQVVDLAREVARKTLNLGLLKQVVVPLAPIEEQREIVRRVEALFALADTIERRVQAAAVRADALTQSILARAFRGELVPTEAELARQEGRDYEPATVLLERVRQRRTAPPSRRNRRHRAYAEQLPLLGDR